MGNVGSSVIQWSFTDSWARSITSSNISASAISTDLDLCPPTESAIVNQWSIILRDICLQLTCWNCLIRVRC